MFGAPSLAVTSLRRLLPTGTSTADGNRPDPTTDSGFDAVPASPESDPAVGSDRSADRGAAITVEGLTKSYGSDTVFSRLDLRIEPAELFCLVGPSGCGKTTLLHLLAGLEEPTAGRVVVDGTPVDGPDHRRGVVFQDPHLYPWLTVRENIVMGPRLRGEEPDSDHVDALIELIGLDGYGDHRPKHLSGGMAQRVSLARTLANDPDLLLLDEPFSALDALTKRTLQDELRRIVSTLGLTAVFVTHDIDEAVTLGERVGVMTDGDGAIAAIRDVGDVDDPHDEAFVDHRRALLGELTEGAFDG